MDPRAADNLLADARSGSSPAFTALVRRHQGSVFSLALRMLSDRHTAEDLAQEVFMQLYRNLAVIESDTHLLFWLRMVTTRLAIDRLRRKPRYTLVPLDEEAELAGDARDCDPDGDPLLLRRLRRLVGELQPAARAVVVLRYQEDLDPTEIADILDMPINTVKSHLKRSLESLREKMS